MANAQILKRRIRSVGNTKQITKAMELVAAAKMRRVQAAAEQSRIYSDVVISILRRLTNSVAAKYHPYFNPAQSKDKLYIIFTSDSGLAGAYNANIFNAAAKAFKEDNAHSIKPFVITFGRKGAHHFSHGSNLIMLGEYENIPDSPDVNVFAPVLDTISHGIRDGKFASVAIIYTEFRSTMSQQVRELQLIPIAPQEVVAEQENQTDTTFELEPEAGEVLASALKLYMESTLRRVRVESAASEHAMRMMSMNNANRNAGDLIDNLTLELNATRQAAITQEMAEIIGGANAIA